MAAAAGVDPSAGAGSGAGSGASTPSDVPQPISAPHTTLEQQANAKRKQRAREREQVLEEAANPFIALLRDDGASGAPWNAKRAKTDGGVAAGTP